MVSLCDHGGLANHYLGQAGFEFEANLRSAGDYRNLLSCLILRPLFVSYMTTLKWVVKKTLFWKAIPKKQSQLHYPPRFHRESICQSPQAPGILFPQALPMIPRMAYLWHSAVELEDLPFSFHLPHTEFANQLHCVQAESFQGEGAVEVSLWATPDVVKWNFLEDVGMVTTNKKCWKFPSNTASSPILSHYLQIWPHLCSHKKTQGLRG